MESALGTASHSIDGKRRSLDQLPVPNSLVERILNQLPIQLMGRTLNQLPIQLMGRAQYLLLPFFHQNESILSQNISKHTPLFNPISVKFKVIHLYKYLVYGTYSHPVRCPEGVQFRVIHLYKYLVYGTYSHPVWRGEGG